MVLKMCKWWCWTKDVPKNHQKCDDDFKCIYNVFKENEKKHMKNIYFHEICDQTGPSQLLLRIIFNDKF